MGAAVVITHKPLTDMATILTDLGTKDPGNCFICATANGMSLLVIEKGT